MIADRRAVLHVDSTRFLGLADKNPQHAATRALFDVHHFEPQPCDSLFEKFVNPWLQIKNGQKPIQKKQVQN